jgi:hypothetical protein
MTRTIFIAAALALAATLPAVPAQAQTRVFVSAAGSDSNNCINTNSPCRHFQQAYNKMPNGGEIDVLDPANYGALTVSHTLSIVGRGWATLSPVAGQPAISIGAGASDKISISGLTLDGANLIGTTGIQFASGANLTISDSVIQNFTGNGINFQPEGSSGISVSRTFVGKNSFAGILVDPQGSASATADFEQVQTQYNAASYGIVIDANATTGSINATATDSISSNNGGGFIAQGPNQQATLLLVRCTASNNHTGVQAGNNSPSSQGIVYLSQVAILGNVIGWLGIDGGTVFTYGDNTIEANTSGNTSPSSSASKK